MTSPIAPPASFSSALTFVSTAQGVAAHAIAAPLTHTTYDNLTRGIQIAQAGADELEVLGSLNARAGDALAFALDGVRELNAARDASIEEIVFAAAEKNVKEHAQSAFNHFEGALEILNNLVADEKA
ncbi:MAG: hypothetical protein JWM25_1797 [Thermoleophilia bacterium]|nr:hypothetical protein [Thermoleophilia bacterium]